MPNTHLTRVVFLLDRSGSMQSIKSDIEGGFAAFIDTQRAGVGDCTVTLAQFDSTYEIVYTGLPINEVPPLDLRPRSRTALLDAMGRLITDTRDELEARPADQRPGTVIVAIMTDGLENASREWTRPAIKALVEQQSNEQDWQFFYLGADQDAVEVGTQLGVKREQAVTYSKGKSRDAMMAVSDNISHYRAAKAADPDSLMPAFSAEQRTELSD